MCEMIEPRGPVVGSIRPPGSKSITNRALVCAALADGTSRLSGVLASEDTAVMVESLRRLGFSLSHNVDAGVCEVTGCGGRVPCESADLFVANSGTTVRFLTALVTLGQGHFRLDGIPRMRERPIVHLLRALNGLGANTRSELDTECPPVVVQAAGLPGGTTRVAGDISSQYLSAMLMVCPFTKSETVVHVEGPLVSTPYVAMTLEVMRDFGVTVSQDSLHEFRFPSGVAYRATQYDIEPDASAASYFWAAAAVTQGKVLVEGLTADALQGDVRFCDCLAQMGCQVKYLPTGIQVTGSRLKGIVVDMNDISDTVLTLAVVALFAEGPTTIRGVGHIRHKETDRIGDLARELRKLGAKVHELEDGLQIIPGTMKPAVIDTYNDHRMAMSFAIAGLCQSGVAINDPGCTAKTYPGFFDDLRKLAKG